MNAAGYQAECSGDIGHQRSTRATRQQIACLHQPNDARRPPSGLQGSARAATREATWDLLDRLGSTVAGTTGASITQLSSYDDWGAQQFETAGWSAPENFTGEATDPTQGLNHYYARTYDPSAATWTSQDPWRGTTDEPRSQHRYGYVWNNPTSNLDIDGNLCARVNPKSDALPVGCGATPVQAHTNVADRSKPPVAPQYPRENPKVDKLKAVGPNSQNDVTDSHGCAPGQRWYTNPYTNGQCERGRFVHRRPIRTTRWTGWPHQRRPRVRRIRGRTIRPVLARGRRARRIASSFA